MESILQQIILIDFVQLVACSDTEDNCGVFLEVSLQASNLIKDQKSSKSFIKRARYYRVELQ